MQTTTRPVHASSTSSPRRGPSLTPKERMQTLMDEYCADYFLTSANAVTRDGMIVNIEYFRRRCA